MNRPTESFASHNTRVGTTSLRRTGLGDSWLPRIVELRFAVEGNGAGMASHGAVAPSSRRSGGRGLFVWEQPVLHREQAGGRSVGRADLDVDVFDVIPGRLG